MAALGSPCKHDCTRLHKICHMNGHLTSVTLGADTLWTLRKQNPRLLPTRIGLGGLNMSLNEPPWPPFIPPKAGGYRAADKEQHRLSPSSVGTEGGTYGAMMGGGTVGNPGVQPYKYGTKEFDRQNGLDWYDSQARMYDPLLGRTPTMDPLSEKYYPISPYAWCAGNPINRIDKNGMDWYFSKDGEIVWDNDVTSSKTTPREGLYLGSNFMGFTVERYQVKNYGLSIRIKHQSTLNTDKQYRWIQAVTTNNPMDGKKSTSIDKSPECDNKPFYYTDEEELKYSSQDRQTTVFIDKPARTKNGDDWNAELCLVSTDENKVYNNITINYGFYVDRIGPVLKKLKIHLNVSPTIQTALDEYEYKQNHEREGEGTH